MEIDYFAAKMKNIFTTTWRLYTGLSYIHEYPRISGRFYIRKPIIYEEWNTRMKKPGYVEIISELPQARPGFPSEYIVVMLSVSYSKYFRPRDYARRKKRVMQRLKLLNKYMGTKHYFIYFMAGKITAGVYEAVKHDFARLINNNVSTIVIRATNSIQIIYDDISRYLDTRIEKLLDKTRYSRSNYEIFARPKRLAEYMLILRALLNGYNDIASYVADLLHHHARIPVDLLLQSYYNIKGIKREETRSIENKENKKPTYPSSPYI